MGDTKHDDPATMVVIFDYSRVDGLDLDTVTIVAPSGYHERIFTDDFMGARDFAMDVLTVKNDLPHAVALGLVREAASIGGNLLDA